MFGNLMRGDRAEYGSLLIGRAMEQASEQLVLVIPLDPKNGGCTVVVPALRRAYAAPAARIEDMFWNVTGHVDWDVDPASFRIGPPAPSEGTLAFDDKDGIYLGAVGDHGTSKWIDLRDGTTKAHLSNSLQFSSWKLIDKASRTLVELKPR